MEFHTNLHSYSLPHGQGLCTLAAQSPAPPTPPPPPRLLVFSINQSLVSCIHTHACVRAWDVAFTSNIVPGFCLDAGNECGFCEGSGAEGDERETRGLLQLDHLWDAKAGHISDKD